MPKSLNDFDGDRIYTEANIYPYLAFADKKFGESCFQFFDRALKGEFETITSALTFDEISFIALKIKLEEKYSVRKNHVKFLKKNPHIVRELARDVSAIIANLLRLSTVEAVVAEDLARMANLMEEYGLLPRDAMHLAVAYRLGITNLASNDSDFDAVPWVKRYVP